MVEKQTMSENNACLETGESNLRFFVASYIRSDLTELEDLINDLETNDLNSSLSSLTMIRLIIAKAKNECYES
jgi:hypothetical protein